LAGPVSQVAEPSASIATQLESLSKEDLMKLLLAQLAKK
jgi:hypothetical protein